MKIGTFGDLEKIEWAISDVCCSYLNSTVYQLEGSGAKCYFGETHDATGDEAIRECFYQYLQTCVIETAIDDDVETFVKVAKALVNALDHAVENEIEVYSTPFGLVVNPDEDETAELNRKLRPRLYIGNGQILADVARWN